MSLESSSFVLGAWQSAIIDDGSRRRAAVDGAATRVDVSTAANFNSAVNQALNNLTSSEGNSEFLASLASSGGALASVSAVEKSALLTTESGTSSDDVLSSGAVVAVAVVGAVIVLAVVGFVVVMQRRKPGAIASRKDSHTDMDPIYASASVVEGDADDCELPLAGDGGQDETMMTTASLDDPDALIELRTAARQSTWYEDPDRVVFHNPVWRGLVSRKFGWG
jgi:hypothetical protein